MLRLTATITLELGRRRREDEERPGEREGQADALVERADPVRPVDHELDRRPLPLGFRGLDVLDVPPPVPFPAGTVPPDFED